MSEPHLPPTEPSPTYNLLPNETESKSAQRTIGCTALKLTFMRKTFLGWETLVRHLQDKLPTKTKHGKNLQRRINKSVSTQNTCSTQASNWRSHKNDMWRRLHLQHTGGILFSDTVNIIFTRSKGNIQTRTGYIFQLCNHQVIYKEIRNRENVV